MSPHKRDDWAKHIPEPRQRGPYRKYGWEAGQSSHPAFRDSSTRLSREEQEEVNRRRQVNDRHARRAMRQLRGEAGQFTSRNNPGNFGQEYGEAYSPHGYHDENFGRLSADRSDDELRDEICQRLTQHGRLDARNIEVKVEHGEAALVGTVHNRRDKRRAENVALTVDGIWDVHNQLRTENRQASANRVDYVGRSGVHPLSGPMPDSEAEVADLDTWSNKSK